MLIGVQCIASAVVIYICFGRLKRGGIKDKALLTSITCVIIMVLADVGSYDVFPLATWNMYCGQDYGPTFYVIRAKRSKVDTYDDVAVESGYSALGHSRGYFMLARLASQRERRGDLGAFARNVCEEARCTEPGWESVSVFRGTVAKFEPTRSRVPKIAWEEIGSWKL
jgi:hypothetical protein